MTGAGATGDDDAATRAVRAALEAAAAAGQAAASTPAADDLALEPLAGGCISDVRRVRWEGGEAVAKLEPRALAPRLDAEAAGLRAIAATDTVRTPAVLARVDAAGHAVLLLEWLAPASPDAAAWERLGRALAALHAADPARATAADGYGWPAPTYLGDTAFPGATAASWPALLVDRRLEPLLRAARDGGGLDARDAAVVGGALARLRAELPATPPRALLHGDLWSGNAHPTAGGDGGAEVAVLDPAVLVGDGWAELGMMTLFGGFPDRCLEAYAEAAGGRPPDAGTRIAAARLLHRLNHLVLFGGGYRAGVVAEARALGG